MRDISAKLRASSPDLCIAGALLLLVLGIYSPVRHFDFIVLDDHTSVPLNRHVMSGLSADGLRWAFTSTEDANWFPLTRISLMADRQLFGPREETPPSAVLAGPYHWTNVMLHAASTLLLFGLLKRITGASGPSAFAAFLFALHPQHVESVAWVSERKDVLSTLFWMLALWSYVSYARRPAAATYLQTLLFFCLGFLSKPMVVTLPLVLLLLDVWPLQRFWVPPPGAGGKLVRRLVWEKLPFFALALLMSVTTYAVQQRGGAVRTLHETSLGSRLENAVISGAVYIGKTVWPTRLAVFYPLTAKQPAWQVIAAGLLLASITVLALGLVRTRPYLAVGWLWYLITILPAIGIIQVGNQALADRYTYIPTIGLSLMLAWSGADAWRRWPKVRPVLAGLGGVACMACAALTGRQISYWENSKALFQHTIEVTGPNAFAHICLGKAWQQEVMYDQAIAEYRKGLAIDPRNPGIQDKLGELLYRQGRITEAIAAMTEAVWIEPGDASLRCHLGMLLAEQGRQSEALAQFAAAIRLKPDYWEAHIRLGNALSSLGRIEEAKAQFSMGLGSGRGSPEAQPKLPDAMPLLDGAGKE